MRTTLTLDPDVAAQLQRLRRRDDRAFKEIVNDLLRQGLRASEASGDRRKRFTTPTANLGEPLIDITSVSEAIAIAEGEDHK